MSSFLCKQCDNYIKITEGDFLFSYNTSCCNNHINKNVNLDNILQREKDIKDTHLKCKPHNKKNRIHCFDCNEDICLICCNKLHNGHKIEYLDILNYDEIGRYNLEKMIKREKIYLQTFKTQLIEFENKLHSYIAILKDEITKQYELRVNLFNNINQKNKFSYNDIENAKNIFDGKYNNLIIENAKNFAFCDTFLKKYEHLKDLFELMFKRGKFIEEKNIKDKIGEYIGFDITPINDDYFLINDKRTIKIVKASFYNNMVKHTIIFEKIYYYYINKIIIKGNYNTPNEFKFLILHDSGHNSNLEEVTVKDLFNENVVNKNETIKNININEKIQNLLVLDNNQILAFSDIAIYLYDDLFNNRKLIKNTIFNYYDSLKINENSFAYTTYDCSGYNLNNNVDKLKKSNLCILKIIDDNVEEKKFINRGVKLSYFSQKRKILFSQDFKFIYLFSLRPIIPEVIQKIRLDSFYMKKDIKIIFNNYNPYMKYFVDFDDDNIYFEIIEKIFKELNYYNIVYIVQFKFIENELKELGRMKES